MDKYKKRILTIFLCNIIDTVATLCLYSTGMFVELNPVMRYFLHSPTAFIIFKMSLVIIVLIRLWQERNDRLAQIVINICWIEYLLLAIYYVVICALYFVIF